MNAELARLRRARGDSEAFNYEPMRLGKRYIEEMSTALNLTMAEIYFDKMKNKNEGIDVDKWTQQIIKNVWRILLAFDKMGIYPDYFYNQVAKARMKYKCQAYIKKKKNNNGTAGVEQYDEESKVHISWRKGFGSSDYPCKQTEEIRKGLKKGFYRYIPLYTEDISATYYDAIDYFDAVGIPHSTPKNILSDEEIKEAIEDIRINHYNIMSWPSNGDGIFDIIDDIEFLSSLLFEYMSFFAVVGLDPADYINAYIPPTLKPAGEFTK